MLNTQISPNSLPSLCPGTAGFTYNKPGLRVARSSHVDIGLVTAKQLCTYLTVSACIFMLIYRDLHGSACVFKCFAQSEIQIFHQERLITGGTSTLDLATLKQVFQVCE